MHVKADGKKAMKAKRPRWQKEVSEAKGKEKRLRMCGVLRRRRKRGLHNGFLEPRIPSQPRSLQSGGPGS